MGKVGKRLALIIGVPFGIYIALYVGSMAMSSICSYSFGNIPSQEWLENSNDVCQLFANLSQLIVKVVNST
jgi:hypothetical protein